jgi:acetylglutamate kinase
MSRPLVIKVGGKALQDLGALQPLLQRIVQLQAERPCVLVHGGGAQVDTWLQTFGHPLRKVDGLRLTPDASMPVVAGALAGALNTQLVSALQQQGTRACGLTLVDANWCSLQHLPALGAVGEPQLADCNGQLLTLLCGQQILPVIASIGQLADGTLVNVNADMAAACAAAVLDADLLLLTDVDAILDQQQRALGDITVQQAQRLVVDNVVAGGMKVKLQTALNATQLSRRSTAVAAWYSQASLTAILSGQAMATRIMPTHN